MAWGESHERMGWPVERMAWGEWDGLGCAPSENGMVWGEDRKARDGKEKGSDMEWRES